MDPTHEDRQRHERKLANGVPVANIRYNTALIDALTLVRHAPQPPQPLEDLNLHSLAAHGAYSNNILSEPSKESLRVDMLSLSGYRAISEQLIPKLQYRKVPMLKC
jgi:hypothetical protein